MKLVPDIIIICLQVICFPSLLMHLYTVLQSQSKNGQDPRSKQARSRRQFSKALILTDI